VNAATDTVKLRLLCAWCGKTMREAEPGSENGSVSHGICDCCAERERAKARRHAEPGPFFGSGSGRPCTTRADQNEKMKPALRTDVKKKATTALRF